MASEQKLTVTRAKRLKQMMQMKHIQRGICDQCGLETVEENIESEGLQIPIMDPDTGKPTNLSLMDYLRQFHKDKVEVRCESTECMEQQDLNLQLGQACDQTRTRAMKITQSPDMLWIQLKRFDNYGRKLTNDVPFLEELDLTEFTDDSKELRYRLYGVIGHAGESVNSGHYLAAVRNSDGNSFATINESAVKQSDRSGHEELQTPRFHGRKEYPPYVLFYMNLDRDEGETED